MTDLKCENMEKIDFVITWVDGSDPEWQADKQKYEKGIVESSIEANAECRYRADSELLRYWFRCVEKFAPWVNRIPFVTCGQKPDWLNEKHPKLSLVNHRDYIPSKYLPTFNSNVIELNLHRLPDLEEQFVMFNDDMYLLKPIDKSLFFKAGNPVLSADLRYPSYLGYNNWGRFLYNDYCIVNKGFNIKRSIWENRNKWFNIKELGFTRVRQNFLCYIANKTLPVRTYEHVANPHLKSSMQELWGKCGDILDNTCNSKFRNDEQVNQYLLCAWNQAKGRFSAINESKRGKKYEICPANIDIIVRTIENMQYPQVCLNDSPVNTHNNECIERICKAFRSILPVKSGFEM